MAELFLAQDTEAGELVVIKRILPYLSHEAEFVQMFLDEARIAAQLHHPNIIQVFELGKLQESIFIAMEYVEGVDLRKVFQEEAKRAQTMPYEIVAFITAQVCAGLAYAHTSVGVDGRPLEIVHRDVSPQNVMVSFDGAIKLVDFGIAKAGALMERSKPGVIKGKFLYLSPEQLSQERLDHRADLFAVGTMMYELTTGKAPFYKPTTEAVIYAIRNDEPVPPQQVRPDFPPELSRIILKCLVKDRSKRYQSAADVQRDLEAFVQRFQPVGELELSSYVGQLFGTEDERTMLHIPTANALRQEPVKPMPVGKRQTGVMDAPPRLPEEPSTRSERLPPARPTVAPPPARRISGVRYSNAGEISEQTHTTEAGPGERPERPPPPPMGAALAGSSEVSLNPGPTSPGDPGFDLTPANATSLPEELQGGELPPPPEEISSEEFLPEDESHSLESLGGRTDPASMVQDAMGPAEILDEARAAEDDEEQPTQTLKNRARAPAEPLEPPVRASRARSFLVFVLAFLVVLGLGLLGLWLLRPPPEPEPTPGQSPEASRLKPGEPAGGSSGPGAVPPSPGAADASAGEPSAGAPEGAAVGVGEPGDGGAATPPGGAPDASAAPSPELSPVSVIFRAPRGTLVLHGGQRLSVNEPHDLPPGPFEYSYQCPGKRLSISASVKVVPQGNKSQVIPLGCRPRR